MQEESLKLKEIIWEITGKCNNNCKYCGSNEAKNQSLTDDQIIRIAKNIAKFPPEQIDISGGDPLTLPYELHEQIVDILSEVGIKCKILFNPKSMTFDIPLDEYNEKIKILKLYEWIGISINTIEELNEASKFIDVNPDIRNFTIITNFNISNLYNYITFEDFVKKNNCPWMIQYTIYNDENNELAIYNNDSALSTFEQKINNSIKNNVSVLLSDNLTKTPCSAGRNSLGITWLGDIIPCLSMRSWNKNIQTLVQSNILSHSLEEIWQTKFIDYRFRKFKCCKDACKNKIPNILPRISIIQDDESRKNINDFLKDLKIEQNEPAIYVYAVQYPTNPTLLYGVQKDMFMMYAVFNPTDLINPDKYTYFTYENKATNLNKNEEAK